MGKSKCGCFWFFGKRKHSTSPALNIVGPTLSQTHSLPSHQPQEPVPQEDAKMDPNVHAVNDHIFIETKFKITDIEGCEITPANTLKVNLKYNCPVCLCFFNKILHTQCCNNYLCHHCAYELKGKEDQYQIRCHYCGISPVYLTDVDPGAAVRNYSDSPFSTIKGSLSANKWPILSLAVVKEIEDEVEFTQRKDLNENFRKTFPGISNIVESDEESCKSA